MIGGFCECGCGGETRIASRTHSRYGYVKGQPLRFIYGHNMRSPEVRTRKSEALRGKKLSPETKAKMSEAQRGPRHYNWKGGRRKGSEGYINVWLPPDHSFAEMRDAKGRVYEHRFVMAEHLDRALSEEEIVHHKNGVIADNRFENLELFENTSAHTSHHRQLGKCCSPSNGVCSQAQEPNLES